MATAKRKKVEAPSGPIFSLGDPEGVVRWTPQMLKKVYSRREMKPAPPSLDTPELIASEMRAAAAAWSDRFEAGAKVKGADPSLHATMREARAWLEAGATERPSLAVAALAYQSQAAGDSFRVGSYAALMLDLWVQRFGLGFALDALVEAFTVGFASTESTAPVTFPARKARKGYGAGTAVTIWSGDLALIRTPHNQLSYLRADDIPFALSGQRTASLHYVNDECRAWLRLREHLASAPLHDWEAVLPRAEALIAHPSALVRHLVAFLFPERPAWAESLASETGHAVHPVLSACVRDPAKLQYVALTYFYEGFEESAASMLAAAGPRAVKHLIEAAGSGKSAAQRYLTGLVAQVDTDEAVDLILSIRYLKHGLKAAETMRENFPERFAAREKRHGSK